MRMRWTGHVEQKFQEFRPQIISFIVHQIPRNFRHQIHHFFPHSFVGFILQQCQDLRFELGFLLLVDIFEKFGEFCGEEPAKHDRRQVAAFFGNIATWRQWAKQQSCFLVQG